ncbi:hypothetical protein ABT187_48000, partial [Streptomyces sp. NPDC001817]
ILKRDTPFSCLIQLEPRELKGWQGTACFPYQDCSGHPHIRQESLNRPPGLREMSYQPFHRPLDLLGLA